MIARSFSQFRMWWGERSARERWLLGVMFALIGCFLLWFAILQPLSRAKANAEARLARATQTAGEVANAAAALSAAKGQAPRTLSGTLASAASASAISAGFTPSSIEPQGDGGVRIVIPAAKSPALFGWIGSLGQQGVLVDRMTAQQGGDGALAVELNVRAPR